jgi:hypothetical protein
MTLLPVWFLSMIDCDRHISYMISNKKLINYVQNNLSNNLKQYIGAPLTDRNLSALKNNIKNTINNISNTLNIPQFNISVQQNKYDPSVIDIHATMPISYGISNYTISPTALISLENYDTHKWESEEIASKIANVNVASELHQKCIVCGMKSITTTCNRDDFVYADADLNCNDYILREVLQ